MNQTDPSRRDFIKGSAGALVVTASLKSPGVSAANASPALPSSITGEVLRTDGRLSPDGKRLIDTSAKFPSRANPMCWCVVAAPLVSARHWLPREPVLRCN